MKPLGAVYSVDTIVEILVDRGQEMRFEIPSYCSCLGLSLYACHHRAVDGHERRVFPLAGISLLQTSQCRHDGERATSMTRCPVSFWYLRFRGTNRTMGSPFF
jgi:hypothetical protein